MTLVGIALLVLSAAGLGWCARGYVPDPPEGTDPEYWRDAWRAFRKGKEAWREWRRARAEQSND